MSHSHTRNERALSRRAQGSHGRTPTVSRPAGLGDDLREAEFGRGASIAILLPDLRPGGAERVAVNLANELAKRGRAVDLVLVSASGELLEDVHYRVNVVDLQATRMRSVLRPLIAYLRRERPQALLACMWPLTVIAILGRMISRVATRLVVAEHTTWSQAEIVSSPFVRWQVAESMHRLFRKADHIVAVSRGAADDLAQFARLPRDSISVVYNPVIAAAPKFTSPSVPVQEWWTGSHRRILAVGTLKQIKDYATLFEALSHLRRTHDARLLILGEGECRTYLEAKIKALSLQGAVFLPGFVRDTAPYYERADLHVLSSTGEGLPTVIIEALAAGLPVVSTDCPSGPREILDEGRFGYLVPVGDSVALANSMARALDTDHDRAALKQRAQFFSVAKATDTYETLLCVPARLGASP